MTTCVAATAGRTAPDGGRAPAGEVHAWDPGTNQTLCGLSLHRWRLWPFAHVAWRDVQPGTGRVADEAVPVCRRCAAASATHDLPADPGPGADGGARPRRLTIVTDSR